MFISRPKNSPFALPAPPRISANQWASSAAVGEAVEAESDPVSPVAEPKQASPQTGEGAMAVVVARGGKELAPFVAAWQELADAACEPNVFFEPWMLLPALEALAPDPAPEFHLVFAPGSGPDSPNPRLCGLFPLVRERGYKGVRTTVLRIWKHLYCALGTPLVKRGMEVETLGAWLDSLGALRRGASLVELGCVSGDGPFGRALVEVFDAREATTFVEESWTRAFLRPQPPRSGDEYLKSAISGKRRKELRRKESRLAEEGAVKFSELEHEADPDGALETYLAEFLRLESSGWKGQAGSAFACNAAHQEFFLGVARQAHARGRLMLAMLRVGDKAIAAKCDFMAGTGAFAFKIGFDEAYARFSPGILLEIEGIRQVHLHPRVRWMDSCAVRNHSMINRLWTERRTLQTVVVATGCGRGEFIVAGLSLLRHFKRMARRRTRRHASRAPHPETV